MANADGAGGGYGGGGVLAAVLTTLMKGRSRRRRWKRGMTMTIAFVGMALVSSITILLVTMLGIPAQ